MLTKMKAKTQGWVAGVFADVTNAHTGEGGGKESGAKEKDKWWNPTRGRKGTKEKEKVLGFVKQGKCECFFLPFSPSTPPLVTRR